MADDLFSPDLFPSGCLVTNDGSDQNHREILYANRYLCELMGLSPAELQGQPVAAVFTNASNIMVDSYVMPMLMHEERCEEILLELKTAGEGKMPVLLNAVLSDTEKGTICWSLFRAVQRNQLYQELVYARHQLQEKARELMELSITDELTGLLNRRELKRRAEVLLAQAARTGQRISLLIFDVDNFMTINDSLGHIAGDRILASFGRLLTEEGRESDIIARYGGDEFLVVMPDAGAEEASKLAARLAAKVGDIEAGEYRFSVSFGISSLASARSETLESLFIKADQALYQAKAARRARAGG